MRAIGLAAAVERFNCRRVERPGHAECVLLLKSHNGFGKYPVIDRTGPTWNAEPEPQQRHPRVLHANVGRRSIWDSRLAGASPAGTNFREFGLEREVLRSVRLVCGKRLTNVLGFNHAGRTRGRIWCLGIVEDVGTHARPMYAPDLR